MIDIDLNQILTFVKVVDSGSFTKAAELLKQPKSRISRRLAALEKTLGTQLIYRTTRQMQLTETGKDYYQRCAPLIQDLENANNAMTSHSEELSGVLRLTAPDDYARLILTPLLDEFIKKHPKIKIEMILSGAYLDLVKESIDVAVRIGTLKDASMKSKRVSSMTSILVASPAFLERNPPITKPEHLEQVNCLAFNIGNKNRWRLFKDKQDLRINVQGNVQANSPEILYHFALLGRGVGLLPEFLCKEAIQSGKLVQLLKGWSSDPIPVQLLTPAQKDIPAKTKAFMDFASSRL